MRQPRRPRRNVAEAACEEMMKIRGLQFTKRGWPDYFVWMPNGYFAAIEVKRSSRHNIALKQRHIMTRLAIKGIPCYLWTPDGGFKLIRPAHFTYNPKAPTGPLPLE